MEGKNGDPDQNQPQDDHSGEFPEILSAEPGPNLEAKEAGNQGAGKNDGQHPLDGPAQIPWYDKMSLTDWIIAAATVVIAGVGIAQWQEMDSAGKQTDRLISLYGQQVAQLSRQAGDTHDLAVAAKTQSEAALIAANTSKRSFDLTRKSAESTIEAICNVNLNPMDIDNPESAGWSLYLRNDGKMTAKNFRLHIEFSRMKLPDMQIVSHIQNYDYSDVPEVFPEPTNPNLNRTIRLVGDAKPDIEDLNRTHEAEIAKLTMRYDNGFGTVKTKNMCMMTIKNSLFEGERGKPLFPCEELGQKLQWIESQRKAAEKNKPN
ncbi:MAG: hypothetical protein ABSD44_03125 [Terracidiphilus sp.]